MQRFWLEIRLALCVCIIAVSITGSSNFLSHRTYRNFHEKISFLIYKNQFINFVWCITMNNVNSNSIVWHLNKKTVWF